MAIVLLSLNLKAQTPVLGTGSPYQVPYWQSGNINGIRGTNSFTWDSIKQTLNLSVGSSPNFALTVSKTSADGFVGVIGNAPSLRFRNDLNGSVLDAIISGATVTNNYLSGTNPGDMILANTKGAILMGGNTVNRGNPIDFRINSAGNILIGGTGTDNGAKLQVNGTMSVSSLGAGTASDYIVSVDALGNFHKVAYTSFAGSVSFSTLGTNYIPKYTGSNLTNSLITDNGINVGINSSQTWGILNVEAPSDNVTGVFDAGRSLSNFAVNGKYVTLSTLTLNGTNIVSPAWAPINTHLTGLSINTTGTLVISGAGTELSNNESHIWFNNSTRTVSGLISGYASLFESQNSGGHIDAVAGYRVTAPINGSGKITNISDFYGVLIDDIAGNQQGQQGITNRWGIYQQGAGDINFFNGNVLLGTNVNAGYKLDVNGQVRIQNTLVLKNITIGCNVDSLVSIDLNGNVKSIAPSRILVNTTTSNNAGTANFLSKFSSGNNIVNSSIYDNGTAVGIGTTSTGPYKLAVEGIIGARKIKVTQSSPWADYVFNEEYALIPLLELENYIKNNNHLPEMPSAKEVRENGIEVGDTQVLLLKKIEELTLYIIDQQKRIDRLEKNKL